MCKEFVCNMITNPSTISRGFLAMFTRLENLFYEKGINQHNFMLSAFYFQVDLICRKP